ncbi:MAG: chromate transporter [Burkholderiaceae bacterium]
MTLSSTLTNTELLQMFGHFVSLSLLAIGGAISTAPDMHRYLVMQQGWLTDAQFTGSIAIAQAAPGPNILFVAVMGYQAAGLAGCAAALLGILLPSTTLALAATRWGRAREDWPAIAAFKAGMAPITLALIVATGWILSAQTPGRAHIIVTAVAALLVWRTKIHLLLLIGAGGAVGAMGWI